MPLRPMLLLLNLALLSACAVPPPPLAMASPGGNFAAFGEDEDICRKAGQAAIQPASPGDIQAATTSAHQYDYAYQRCMFFHGQRRQMRAMTDADADGPQPRENLHSFDYPDAFYSIPYATPGYGYDGFSGR